MKSASEQKNKQFFFSPSCYFIQLGGKRKAPNHEGRCKMEWEWCSGRGRVNKHSEPQVPPWPMAACITHARKK